jgi:broad specificity phosphatase PhoE
MSIILDLYLTRHGQSYGQMDLDGVHLGNIAAALRPPGCETGLMEDDWRLTPLGQRQAALLGESLAQIPFDAIFCSPLERARSTAGAIAQRQLQTVPLRVLRDLLEVGDYGDETPEETHGRALRAASDIRSQAFTGARVLIVAHGAFNNRLLTALLGLPGPEHLFRFGQDNTGLTRILYASEDVPPRKRVRLYCLNDLSHLPPDVRSQTIKQNERALYGTAV